MTMKKWMSVPVLMLVAFLSVAATDENCGGQPAPAQSASGISKSTVRVAPGSDGLTVEQRNVGKRITADNKPGSIKHLYVISAYSGQVLIYSTVNGKVTSSGKRLQPKTVVVGQAGEYQRSGFAFGNLTTNEVLEDDGTYGDSVPYIYWFDAKGSYHQHYIEGGQVLHISDTPLAVKSVVLNMELEK